MFILKTMTLLAVLLLVGCNESSNSEANEESIITTEKFSISKVEIPVADFVFDGLTAGSKEGTAVILLHGFPSTADQYSETITALADEGYYVIAPNQRGYSAEARPLDVEDYHPRYRAQDVIDITDALGIDEFHLVGHNAGALISWSVAAINPDRVITLSVISVPHPQAFIDAFLDEGTGQAEMSSYSQDYIQPGFEETFIANDHQYMKDLLDDTPVEAINFYVEQMGSLEAMKAALNVYRAADWGWYLSQGLIYMPTLQIWGDEDIFIGLDAMQGSENYVEGEYSFEILPGVSHWVSDTAPDELSALLIEHFKGR